MFEVAPAIPAAARVRAGAAPRPIRFLFASSAEPSAVKSVGVHLCGCGPGQQYGVSQQRRHHPRMHSRRQACLQTPAGTSPLGPVSAPTIYQLKNPAGQAVGDPRDVCPALGGGGGKAAGAGAAALPPPPPPPPPTPAEVWAQTPLPTPRFDFNPADLGLVHLATWFWLTGVGGPITATSSIRGYRVVTTAHPVAAYWYFGDGDSAQGGGSGEPGGSVGRLHLCVQRDVHGESNHWLVGPVHVYGIWRGGDSSVGHGGRCG